MAKPFGTTMLLTAWGALAWAQSADNLQEKKVPDLNERVEVVNIELVARVKRDGKPVGDLKREDFLLNVNGRRMEINGFREERHRISPSPPPEAGASPPQVSRTGPERLFVLSFWLWDRHASFSEALDHFFRDIYRPSDRVILAHPRGVETVESPDQVTAVRSRFESGLRRSIDADNIIRQQLFRQIDDAIKEYAEKPADGGGRRAKSLLDAWKGPFQKRLNDTWEEFRTRFLKGDSKALIRLADRLKPLDGEKWVLVFLQEEQYPIFDEKGPLTAAYGNPLDEMRKTLGNETTDFDEAVRSAFINANASLSLIRLNCRNREEQGRSVYYRFKAVQSNREDAYRRISRATGGAIIADNNLVRALDRAAAREDICYIISYAPADGKRKQGIRLVCRDPSLQVIAGRRQRLRALPLTVDRPRIIDSVLTFPLRGYARIYEEGRLQGRVRVEVIARGPGSHDVESSREFTPTGPAVEIPVALRLPPGRRCRFIIRVRDLLSGAEAIRETTLRGR